MEKMRNPAEELLLEGAALLGLPPLQKETVGKFMVYLRELKKWNRTHNLTAIDDDREIIIKHFLDSALYLKAIGGRGRNIADIGSGAGFPGVVLKLLDPALSVSLVEPAWKKAVFLRHITRELGLEGIRVLETKIEDLPVAEPYDIALTRALFKVPDFIRKAGAIVKKGGFFIMSKGPSHTGELEGTDHEILSFNLPFTDAKRFVIIIVNGQENIQDIQNS